MKTSVILLAIFGRLLSAFPIVEPRDISMCNAISQQQCCEVDVDGILSLTCESRQLCPYYPSPSSYTNQIVFSRKDTQGHEGFLLRMQRQWQSCSLLFPSNCRLLLLP